MYKRVYLVLFIVCYVVIPCGSIPIKLGILMPITPSSVGSKDGLLWTQIAQAAVWYINDQGYILNNHTIDLRVYDTHDTPSGTAYAAIQSVLVDKCVGLIGTAHSQYSELIQNIIQNYGIPQISPLSTASELSNKLLYPTFLRTIPSDTGAGLAIARAVAYFKWEKVGIILGSDPYSTSLHTSFSSVASDFNITILVECVLAAITPDYSNEVRLLKNAYAQVILVFAEAGDTQNILIEAYSQGIVGGDYVWIGADAMLTINTSILPLEALAGNLIVSPSSVVNSSLLAMQYEAQMKSLNISYLLGGFIYDSVYTYANAFNKLLQTNSTVPWEDPKVLLTALFASNFSGVSGNITFNSSGDRLESGYDIVNFQNGEKLVQVAQIRYDGQVNDIAPVIWPDGSTKIPKDFITIIVPAPRADVRQTFFVITIFFIAVLGILALIFIVILFSQSSIPKPRYFFTHMANTFGGALGYTSILLIVAGVSKIHCTLAPALVDLSLLICGGVISFRATHKFVAEYHDFNQARYFSATTISNILYGIWGVLMALNLGVLVGTFLYEHPDTRLYNLERNLFEKRCKFGQLALILLPCSIAAVFVFSLVTTFLKIFINNAVATQKIDIVNSSNSMITLAALVVAAVTLATIEPNQTQIDIILCVIIIIANLHAPANLFGWLFSPKRRNIILRRNIETTPLLPRHPARRERGSMIFSNFFPDFNPTSSSPSHTSPPITYPPLTSPPLSSPLPLNPPPTSSRPLNAADLGNI